MTFTSNQRSACSHKPLSSSLELSSQQVMSRWTQPNFTGINNWPMPHTVKHVQAFLGFCNFYQCFIKDYLHIAHPLFQLTNKNTPFPWSPAQGSAFRTLIHTFTTAPAFALLDHSNLFHLTETYSLASQMGLLSFTIQVHHCP